KERGGEEEERGKEMGVRGCRQERSSLGKASELLGINQIKFQRLLSERGICIHYDVAEFQEDIKHLKEKGWL
ncbi:MAG: UPF0175 family protein, partial [Microcystis panniformis]